MKSHRVALFIAFSAGLVGGIWLIAREQSELRAQEPIPADEVRHDIIAAEAELDLTKEMLKYANETNDELRGIYPPSFIEQLEFKQSIASTYLAELKKDEPEFRNVVIQVAIADVEQAKRLRDRETDKRKGQLREFAVRAAEKRLALAKSTRDDQALQDWLIRHLILELVNLRLDLEHTR